MHDANLLCPHCGAAYQPADQTCPNCGRALSPTGYSRYGGGEQLARAPQPIIEPNPPAPSTRTIAPRRLRQSNRGNIRINTAPIYGTVALIFVVVIAFLLTDAVRNSRTGGNAFVIPTFAPPTATPAFACLPPAEATEFAFLPDAVATGAIPAAVGTLSYLQLTPTPNPTMSPAQPMVSYTLIITTDIGALRAKMYDVGAAISPFPQPARMDGQFYSADTVAAQLRFHDDSGSSFTPNDLPVKCGNLLLPVRGNQLYADFLAIAASNDAAIQFPHPSTDPDHKYQTFLVVGQLVSGYDVLGKLRAGSRVIDITIEK